MFTFENEKGLNFSQNPRSVFQAHQGDRGSPAAIAVVGLDGYLKRVNPIWEKILGYSTGELLAIPLLELVHPEDRPLSRAEWKQMADGVTTISFENRCRCKDGSYKWLWWKATPMPKKQVIHAIACEIAAFKQQQTEALWDNEQLYRGIFEAAAIGMAIATPSERKIIKSNRVLQQMFGYSDAELQGLSFDELTHPDDRLTERSLFQEVLIGVRDSFQSESRYLRKNGEVLWGRLTASLIPNAKGQPQIALGIIEDISQRVRMETELRESIKELSDLKFALDRAAIVAVTDDRGVITHVNDTFCQISKYSRAELLGKTHRILNSGYHSKTFFQDMWSTLRQGNIWKGEIKNKAKDGTYYWVDTTIVPFLNDKGKPVQYLAIRYEITERKQVEEQMKQTQAFLESILENIPVGVYIKDAQNLNFVFWNKASEEVFGLQREAAIGKNEYEFLPPELADTFIEKDRKALTQGEMLDIPEQHIHTSDRGWRILHTRKVPIADETGSPQYLLGISEDISDRKRNEEALQRSEAEKTALIASLQEKTQHLETTLRELQRAQTQLVQSEKMSSLGLLVAGVAHEINNPVNFIYGNLIHADEYIEQILELVQLYQQYYPKPAPEIAAHVEAIDLEFITEDLPMLLASMKLGTERIREIVRSLRIFSRIEESQMKPVNIHEGIDSTLLILHNRLKAKPNRREIKIIKEFGNLPQVECYASKLNQVFMNLIGNAIDALEENSEVTNLGSEPFLNQSEATPIPTIQIRTSVVNNDSVAIAISDNGCGMTPEVKAHLFDPFFTTKPVGSGTGLGLAISHQIIVEKHGGHLTCVSEIGKGSEFLIHIPIHHSKSL